MLYVIGHNGRNVITTWHVGERLRLTEQQIIDHALVVQADSDEANAIEQQGFPRAKTQPLTYLYGDLAKTFLLNIR
jgi:hypothetical protein